MERENPMQMIYRQKKEKGNLLKLLLSIPLKALMVQPIQKSHHDNTANNPLILPSYLPSNLTGLFFVTDKWKSSQRSFYTSGRINCISQILKTDNDSGIVVFRIFHISGKKKKLSLRIQTYILVLGEMRHSVVWISLHILSFTNTGQFSTFMEITGHST